MPNADTSRFLPLPNLPFHILLALAEGEMHGWAVVKRIEVLTQGVTRPSSGSLYLAINRMQDQGLVENAEIPKDETDSRRRYHRLTPLGTAVLRAEVDRLNGLVSVARSAGI